MTIPSEIPSGTKYRPGVWAKLEDELILNCVNDDDDIDTIQKKLYQLDIETHPEHGGRSRPVENIRKRIVKLKSEKKFIVSTDETTYLRIALHAKEWWPYIKRQFQIEDLKFFEAQWVIYQQQFGEDVLATEELQLKQLITVDIFVTKNVIKSNTCEREIEKLQVRIAKEYKKSMANKDIDLIANLENQISSIEMSKMSYTTEFLKLLDKQEKLLKDLKANREARVKRIEDSKTSWAGMIRVLEQEEQRKRTGDDMEVMKIAKNHQRDLLSEWHKYEDGKLDQPFLTPETVKDEEISYEIEEDTNDTENTNNVNDADIPSVDTLAAS